LLDFDLVRELNVAMYKQLVTLSAVALLMSASVASAHSCVAAPAIASELLRELDMRPKAHATTNIYAMIASYMGTGASFSGLERCDEGYTEEVYGHIIVPVQ
jgi:hypothetical protein